MKMVHRSTVKEDDFRERIARDGEESSERIAKGGDESGGVNFPALLVEQLSALFSETM